MSYLEQHLSPDMYTFAFRRGVETRPTTLEVVTVSRDARGGRLNSRYRSTSSTTVAKLPRGCMATERMRNQVVSTTIYRTEIHVYTRNLIDISSFYDFLFENRTRQKSFIYRLHMSHV